MAQGLPFIRFLASPNNVLLGFTLSALPSLKATSKATQLRLINALWTSGVAAFNLRFVTTTTTPGVAIYLFCRITSPGRQVLFQDHFRAATQRVQRLFKECDYTLQPLMDEVEFDHALQPFPINGLGELRRYEELFTLQEAYTASDLYVPYPWEWIDELPLHYLSVLAQQRTNCMVSVYLEPTRLSNAEACLLAHASSPQVNALLARGGIKGEIIYSYYRMLAQNLQQPFLLRICLAAATQQAVALLGQALLYDHSPSSGPILQFPHTDYERQAVLRNLWKLEWVPWGDIRDSFPDTARLRYLVDSKGATMGFPLPVAPDPATPKNRVLLVFANPHMLSHLRLGSEDRVIHEAIKLSRYRDNIVLKVLHAATIHDLSRALLEDEFDIVHIAGHGTSDGLILEDEGGKAFRVPQQALADLFIAYNASLRCVVLNACYGLEQGELIALGVDFTIAMENAVNDNAAREFARGFYDALGAGKEITFAYDEGCRRARLAAPNTTFSAQLLKKTS